MPTYRLGRDAELAYNTDGIGGGGTWVAITNAKDVTINGETVETDVSMRATGKFKATAVALIDLGVEFEMVWDPDDAGFAALHAAWLSAGTIGIRVSDRPYTDPGARGHRFDAVVTNFSKSEPQEGHQTVSVTVKPTLTNNPPEEFGF
ncbi:MAG: hypothetical protein HRF50_04490 [Phycisphaerae bacterium]|jgi:hypothetical protein